MRLKGLVGRTTTLIAVGVAASTIAAAPALAGSPNGQTVTQTQHVHGSFYDPNATNPCNGDTFNGAQGILFTGNMVNHVTFFTQSDEVWATFTETGTITGTDDGTGAVYAGRATVWGNFNLNQKNTNQAFTLTVHATGSDGSSISGHQTAVFVMNANGTVTVNFTKTVGLTCG